MADSSRVPTMHLRRTLLGGRGAAHPIRTVHIVPTITIHRMRRHMYMIKEVVGMEGAYRVVCLDMAVRMVDMAHTIRRTLPVRMRGIHTFTTVSLRLPPSTTRRSGTRSWTPRTGAPRWPSSWSRRCLPRWHSCSRLPSRPRPTHSWCPCSTLPRFPWRCA